MNRQAFVTCGQIETLATDLGAVTGRLRRDLNVLSGFYIELQGRIAALEARLASPPPARRPKRARATRRQQQPDEALATE